MTPFEYENQGHTTVHHNETLLGSALHGGAAISHSGTHGASNHCMSKTAKGDQSSYTRPLPDPLVDQGYLLLRQALAGKGIIFGQVRALRRVSLLEKDSKIVNH